MWYKRFWLTLGSFLVIGKALSLSGESALAQSNITVDNTLGAQTSVVTPNLNINGINSEVISGGATRGVNLFHSFREFNVDSGRGAYFTNPAGIENILTRVTGTNPSKILGTLGVIGGNANLFLMNPNGIIFGENARLDIRGSFVGTTANGIGLTNGDIFSANPLQPTPSQLLNVNPNAFLFNQIANQQINSIQINKASLSVPNNKNLLLLGGNVSLDNAKLQAANGAIELGGVAGSGKVGLQVNGGNLSLSFPLDIPRADVSFINNASVNVTDKGAGRVGVTARNIDLLEGSQISAGIGQELTADNSPRGDVTFNATGKVTIREQSRVRNVVNTDGTGNAGDINIKGGDIFITHNRSAPTKDSFLPAALDTGPLGKGRAGNISVEANGLISLIGQDVNSEDRVISTYGDSQQGLGDGNISLKANGSIFLSNAYFKAGTENGNAGNILLIGNDVSLSSNSSLFSGGPEKAGNITIQSSGPVSIQNSLVASVGNPSGDIKIFARSVSVTAGAELTTRSFEGGQSGNIQINATDFVEIAGRKPSLPLTNERSQSIIYSALLTSSVQGSTGVNGDINIQTGILRVLDGASLRAENQSNLTGGNINVNANVVELTDGGQLVTTAFKGGDAGDINLNVSDRITVDGSNPSKASLFNRITNEPTNPELIGYAQLGYATQIAKRSGREVAEFLLGSANSASGIFASTSENSTAQGGNVKITTGKLQVQDTGQISVSSDGQGNAGSLNITAHSIQLNNQGKLQATTTSGEGGNIDLQVRDFILMRRNSLISAEAGNNANGGDITINAPLGFILGVKNENSDIIANADQGKGGRITITSAGVYGLQKRPELTDLSDINASSQAGPQLNGSVEINNPSIDPSEGLVNLPVDIVEPQVSQVCQVGSRGTKNRFVITGRGGLPASPIEPVINDAAIANWITIDAENQTRSTQSVSSNPNKPTPQPIVEASGWAINAKGEVFLTADASTVTPHSSWRPATHCGASQ